MFGLLRDVHWWSSVERQLAGFESLPLILHRFSELSIHNGHSGVHESERVSRPCTTRAAAWFTSSFRVDLAIRGFARSFLTRASVALPDSFLRFLRRIEAS